MDEIESIEDCLKNHRQYGIVRDEPEDYEIGMRMPNADPISEKLSTEISRLAHRIFR